MNSATPPIFQAASASLNSDKDDFSTDYLQKSSEFLNIWKDNQQHGQYCSLMTISHLLHFDTFLQLMFNHFSIFFMLCFKAFTHITLVLTESSILTFLRLVHIFFHDRTISSYCLCFLFCNSQGSLN